MDDGLIWILVGLVLLMAEIVVPGVFLLWIGLAALGTGLVTVAFAPGFATKVVVFLLLLAAGIATALALRRRQRPTVRVNTPDAGLVGRVGTVTGRAAAGARVRVGDSDWAARIAGEAEVGDTVRVDGVDGTVLVVSRVAR
ncbi:NfeD family protein [Elioraea sp.]|uniref:NfeD family protein n=1 Tax=Elioraea sp. TaxID=2185103 RepID=UPI003F6E5ADF